MKAWYVEWDHGGDPGPDGFVIFAETRGKARQEGVARTWTEWTDPTLSVRREPKYDCYAEQGKVPDWVLVEDGWWVRCTECGDFAPSGDCDDAGYPLPVFWNEQNRPYCSLDCLQAMSKQQKHPAGGAGEE